MKSLKNNFDNNGIIEKELKKDESNEKSNTPILDTSKKQEQQKLQDIQKQKISISNENSRINNFINPSNANTNNIHNRYYSTHITNNFLKKNFINKSNSHEIANQIKDHNYIIESRPYSLNNSRAYNYILGNINPDNIKNKEIKKDGYDYKKYKSDKRNNFIHKNIYNQNINNIISKHKFLHMNDFMILNNLDVNIANLKNKILSEIYSDLLRPNYNDNNHNNNKQSINQIVNNINFIYKY